VAFLRAAYGWMCAGLAITAATAWFVASSPSLLRTIATSGPLYLILIVAQLGIVFVLSARVQRLSAATASWLFIGYSVLTGVTLSFIMLVYTGETLTSTFVVATCSGRWPHTERWRNVVSRGGASSCSWG
jgi:FtsH-binding integral membrane protein